MYLLINNFDQFYFQNRQKLLEECNYVANEKKMPQYITDVIEISSDSDREDSYKENSDEENYVQNGLIFIFKTVRVISS